MSIAPESGAGLLPGQPEHQPFNLPRRKGPQLFTDITRRPVETYEENPDSAAAQSAVDQEAIDAARAHVVAAGAQAEMADRVGAVTHADQGGQHTEILANEQAGDEATMATAEAQKRNVQPVELRASEEYIKIRQEMDDHNESYDAAEQARRDALDRGRHAEIEEGQRHVARAQAAMPAPEGQPAPVSHRKKALVGGRLSGVMRNLVTRRSRRKQENT